jgi:hypothetical protein
LGGWVLGEILASTSGFARCNGDKTMFYKALLLVLPFFGFAFQACPQGLAVAPGLWETASQITVTVAEEGAAAEEVLPREAISQACIRPGDMILEPIDLAGPDCTVSDVSLDTPEMSFVLMCQRGGVTFYGTMTAVADGTGTITEAHMMLTGRRADGREVQITADTQSHRTGPCLG